MRQALSERGGSGVLHQRNGRKCGRHGRDRGAKPHPEIWQSRPSSDYVARTRCPRGETLERPIAPPFASRRNEKTSKEVLRRNEGRRRRNDGADPAVKPAVRLQALLASRAHDRVAAADARVVHAEVGISALAGRRRSPRRPPGSRHCRWTEPVVEPDCLARSSARPD